MNKTVLVFIYLSAVLYSEDFPLKTVAEVLKMNSGQVRCHGQFIEKTGPETFSFKDSTGVVDVIVERDDYFPYKLFKERLSVEIKATVDRFLVKGVELQFESFEVLKDEIKTDKPIVVQKEKSVEEEKQATAKLNEPVLMTIKDVLKEKPLNQRVQILGQVQSDLGQGLFHVKDATGQILVSIAEAIDTRDIQENKAFKITGTLVQTHDSIRPSRRIWIFHADQLSQ